MNVRAVAAKTVMAVMHEGESLTQVLAANKQGFPAQDAALLQELCYGVLRWGHQLTKLLSLFMSKPLRAKDADVMCLLLVGLYQLRYMRLPDYAVVSQTVEAAQVLRKAWAKNLLNAVLRAYLKRIVEKDIDADLRANDEYTYSHPAWMIGMIKQAWPQHWQAILNANNQKPPLTIRVNTLCTSREDYLQRLESQGIAYALNETVPSAIEITQALPVTELPGFEQGVCSVQDASAQIAAGLLNLSVGQRVLDVCAAPGGKTLHILESEPKLQEVVALDSDAARITRIEENLARVASVGASVGAGVDARIDAGKKVPVTLITGDAQQPQTWWDGKAFDRILVDAPCSASGVIRRHPDIKWLRRAADIESLTRTQINILNAAWTMLKPGGVLVYATCSIFPQENMRQISIMIDNNADVHHLPIEAQWGHACEFGRQILPGENNQDGFYYACLLKQQ